MTRWVCNVLYHTTCLNILIIAIFIILKKIENILFMS